MTNLFEKNSIHFQTQRNSTLKGSQIGGTYIKSSHTRRGRSRRGADVEGPTMVWATIGRSRVTRKIVCAHVVAVFQIVVLSSKQSLICQSIDKSKFDIIIQLQFYCNGFTFEKVTSLSNFDLALNSVC